MTYGYTAEAEGDDSLIEVIDLAIRQLGVALKPGATPVDTLPWRESVTSLSWELSDSVLVKHYPIWAPGAGFKRTAAEFKAKVEESAARPFRWVQSKIADGSAEPSFMSFLHEKAGGRLEGKTAHEAMWTAQAMYAGGADTVRNIHDIS